MKIWRTMVISLAALISLTACAELNTAKKNPAADFAFTYRDFDLRYAWNSRQTDQGVRIDGLVKNVRYPHLENLEIQVALLDKAKKVIAQGVSFRPSKLELDDYTSFGLLLKGAKLSEGDQLRFLTTYIASEGQNAFPWSSNFTVNATTGKVIGRYEYTEDEW